MNTDKRKRPVRLNLFLVDMPIDKEWPFLKGLEESSGLSWNIAYREGRLRIPFFRRLWNFVFYPLRIYTLKKANKIVAWQQFYGIMYLFYDRLLGHKKVDVSIMTFIYKERSGFLGKLYKEFLSFSLKSLNLKNIIVFSQSEKEFYLKCFPFLQGKIHSLPLCIAPLDKGLGYERHLVDENYIFTAGASNRDYDFLISVLDKTEFHLKIAWGGNVAHGDNVEILHNVYGEDMYRYLYNCKMVVIPLLDLNISSGQLMLLQAMQLGKPIIVTNNSTIYDYVVHGQTGLILANDKKLWLEAIQKIYRDRDFYDMLSKNEINSFKHDFSLEKLGEKVGLIV